MGKSFLGGIRIVTSREFIVGPSRTIHITFVSS